MQYINIFTSSRLTNLTVQIYTFLHTFVLWWCHLMEKSELFYTFEHIHQHIYISVALLYAMKHTHICPRVPGDNALRFCAGKLFCMYITFRFSHRNATIYHNHSIIITNNNKICFKSYIQLFRGLYKLNPL